MDIYQETYEQIAGILDQARSSGSKPKAPAAHDDLDMYADDFDVKEKQKLGDPESTATDNVTQSPELSNSQVQDLSSESKVEELRWEYKRSKDDTTMIEGPFSSAQMQKWTEEGKFGEEIWVRKVGASGDFYSNRRVDFELYL